MRLGGPIFGPRTTPEEWVAAVRRAGYRAAYCPLEIGADDSQADAYAAAAGQAGLIIAEVGAWSNPISTDDATRRTAVEKCRAGLALADRIGARCCVNVAGSRGERWAGPSAANLTDETFDLIVGAVRSILDAVRPTRTFYALETMPWMYPDSADAYVRLIRAIDRKQFAVHFDPVNIICSPQKYYRNAEVIRDFVAKLGPHIKSCHAKDILLQDRLTVHLDEVRPGCGALDYSVYLTELARLDGDLPLMLEHLRDAADYEAAAAHIRQCAVREGIAL